MLHAQCILHTRTHMHMCNFQMRNTIVRFQNFNLSLIALAGSFMHKICEFIAEGRGIFRFFSVSQAYSITLVGSARTCFHRGCLSVMLHDYSISPLSRSIFCPKRDSMKMQQFYRVIWQMENTQINALTTIWIAFDCVINLNSIAISFHIAISEINIKCN